MEHMLPWQDGINRELSKKDLREQYIATQAVIIQALGRVGAAMYVNPEIDISEKLLGLEKINWRRNNLEWKGRVIRSDGKMLTSNEAIILAGNIIKSKLSIPLNEEEIFIEEKYKKRK